jgi:ribosome-associated protein
MSNIFLGLAKKACVIADSKNAVDPIILNIKHLSTVADYLFIASGESSPQINAIVDTIYKTFRDEENILPSHRDGWHSDSWCVIDYGGLIVHVMNSSARKLYALEKIWDEATTIKTPITKSLPRRQAGKIPNK